MRSSFKDSRFFNSLIKIRIRSLSLLIFNSFLNSLINIDDGNLIVVLFSICCRILDSMKIPTSQGRSSGFHICDILDLNDAKVGQAQGQDTLGPNNPGKIAELGSNFVYCQAIPTLRTL